MVMTLLQSQSSAGDLGPVAWVGGYRGGKLNKFAHSCNNGTLCQGHVNDNHVYCSDNVCSSAHTCVVRGRWQRC